MIKAQACSPRKLTTWPAVLKIKEAIAPIIPGKYSS